MKNQDLISIQWLRKNQVAQISTEPLVYAIPSLSDEFLKAKILAESGTAIHFEERSVEAIKKINLQITETDELIKNIDKNSSWEEEPVINLVDSFIEEGVRQKASDIHFESKEDEFIVRFRKDGILTHFKTLPKWLTEPILVRLKLLAKLDITERRLPQDGSFIYVGMHENYKIRLSTLPTEFFEKCVLRLLALEKEFSLKELIYSPAHLEFLRQIFNKPSGIFLVTGPTGSGKSTTLYAGLSEIVHKPINITTIENPIEYTLKGLNQVEIQEKIGLTFAKVLRSILRQDPDVILIGEIRDEETAKIAFQAAQTGHLVFSTLHTNNAKNAISRLNDLGIDELSIKESLLGVMAQRLVRKLNAQNEYEGRLALIEIINNKGEFIDGDLYENAQKFVKARLTDEREILRVMG